MKSLKIAIFIASLGLTTPTFATETFNNPRINSEFNPLNIIYSSGSQSSKKIAILNISESTCLITDSDICLENQEQIVNLSMDLDVTYRKNQFLTEIAVLYANLGEYETAQLLAENISKPMLKAKAFLEIGTLLARAGQKEDALQLFKEAENFAQNDLDLLAEIILQSTFLLQPENKTQALERVIKLAEKENNSFKQVDLLTHIVGQLFITGRKEEAEEILDKVIAVAQTIKKDEVYSWGAIRPRWSVWTNILDTLIKTNQEEHLFKVIEIIRKSEDEGIRFNSISDSIAQSISRLSSPELITKVFNNLKSDILLYEDLISSTSFEEYKNNYQSIINIVNLIQQEKFESALTLTPLIQRYWVRARILTALSVNLKNQQKTIEADELLRTALASKPDSANVPSLFNPTDVTLTVAIQLAQLGEFEQAFQLIYNIPDASYQSLGLLMLVNEFNQAGERTQALDTLKKILNLSQSLRS